MCKPTWIIKNNTNSKGVHESDSFTIPDVDTCLNECARLPDCVAVDINVDMRPMICWPHTTPSHLRDDNIYRQEGTNHYQLTGSCASSEPINVKLIYSIIL